MDQIAPPPPPIEQPPPYVEPPIPLLQVALTFLSPLFFLLAIWLAVDAYRRYGGLNYWHALFVFFTPFAVVVYLLVHGRTLFRRRDGSKLFGPSLRTRLRQAEQNARLGDTVAAHAELAELLFEAREFGRCEEEYGKVLAQEPDSQEALYYLALCRMERGDFQSAAERLDRVLAENPKYRFGLAALKRSECWRQLGRTEEALEERRKLHRTFPRPLFEFAYAELLMLAGRRDEARKVLEEMLDAAGSAPAEDRPWLSQGRSLLRSLH